MKRIHRFSLSLILAFVVGFSSAAWAAIGETVDSSTIKLEKLVEDYYPAKAVALNKIPIYQYMQSGSKKLGTIKKGTEFEVLEIFENYARISTDLTSTQRAYIKFDNVNITFKNPIHGTIRLSGYAYASMNAAKKYRQFELKKGSDIALVARCGAWWQFELDKKTYFAQRKAVSIPSLEINTDSPAAALSIPNQSYIGEWNTADDPPDALTITEIKDNSIKFEIAIFRTVAFSSTAKVKNNKITFIGTDGPDISGTLEFGKSSIKVTIDKSTFDYISAGTVYNFTAKVK